MERAPPLLVVFVLLLGSTSHFAAGQELIPWEEYNQYNGLIPGTFCSSETSRSLQILKMHAHIIYRPHFINIASNKKFHSKWQDLFFLGHLWDQREVHFLQKWPLAKTNLFRATAH